MAPYSSILAWRTLWTEEPGGLQSMGSRRVGHDCSDLACSQTNVYLHKNPVAQITFLTCEMGRVVSLSLQCGRRRNEDQDHSLLQGRHSLCPPSPSGTKKCFQSGKTGSRRRALPAGDRAVSPVLLPLLPSIVGVATVRWIPVLCGGHRRP